MGNFVKLTEDDVRTIRRRYIRGRKHGNRKELMAEYNISKTHITDTVNGVKWSDVR